MSDELRRYRTPQTYIDELHEEIERLKILNSALALERDKLAYEVRYELHMKREIRVTP